MEEADSTHAIGSMEGAFELNDGTLVDYSVNFSAEVTQTSTFCD